MPVPAPSLLLAVVQAAGAAGENAVGFDDVAVPLAVAAALAVAVERVLELLKNVSDLFIGPPAGIPSRSAGARVKPLRDLVKFHEAERARAEAEAEQERLEAQIAGLPAAARNAVRKKAREPAGFVALEVEEGLRPGVIVVQGATPPDAAGASRALTLQLVAAALGILAARLFGVRLFEPLLAGADISASADYLLTGLVIGGGSGPVHMLIRFIGERKVTLPAEPEREETAVAAVARPLTVAERGLLPAAPSPGVPAAADPGGAAAAVAVDLEAAWIPIEYRGGVDRDRLESVHRRRKDPDTIIYHHTAMHRSSTFEDVVRVIKDRRTDAGVRWLTGYNCVVTEDGVVHPFCRWDRYGNHAAGWNARSLGIALNGNFEPDGTVPWSNPDGRFGPARPAREQLEAAARVVALWALLYDIPLDFDERIIPHSQVSPKTCPGSGFPEADFKDLVTRFHGAWSDGPERAHVQAFDRLPYLHV